MSHDEYDMKWILLFTVLTLNGNTKVIHFIQRPAYKKSQKPTSRDHA